MTRRLSLTRSTDLAARVGARPLLAFDFDGVLAPMEARARDVRVRPRTRALLARLSREATCAVLSGRSVATLRTLTRGLRFAELIGNHGAERRGHAVANAGTLTARVREWRQALEPVVARLNDGVELEDKRVSLSLHYRHTRAPARARRILLTVCDSLPGARVVPGKRVLNVVSASAPDKGRALRALARELRPTGVLFVGDDRTDESVFRLRSGWPELVTVRVGASRRSAARYHLASQREVDGLLATLVELLAR